MIRSYLDSYRSIMSRYMTRCVRSLRSLFTVRFSLFTFFALFTVHCSLFTAFAQRDYFTPEEVEMIRDAQQIDQRIDLLVKIIDRRFSALNIDVGGAKVSPKDSDKWGTLAGTRSDYFFDIKRILQKAIDDIDNLSERPESMVIQPDEKDKDKKPKGFGDLFPIAIRSLAHAAERWKPSLTVALDATKDQKE